MEGFCRLHLAPAFGKILVDDMTSSHLTRFIAMKQKANATINRHLSALRHAVKLGQEALPPLVTSFPKIKLLEEDNIREGFLEHDQYLRFREELPAHQRLILVIGYHFGFRLGEILCLRWDQVDWDENEIRLERKQTKGKHARGAPLYGELRVWLDMARSDPARGATVVSYHGKPIKEVKTAWDKAAIRAGVPGLLRHDMRRTAVRNMIRAGIPENRAMLISGHRDPNVFRRYDITSAADLKEDGARMEGYLVRKAEEAAAKVSTKVSTEVSGMSGEGMVN